MGQKAVASSPSFSLQKVIKEQKLLEIQKSGVLAGFLPTVILKGYYGANYFDQNFEIFKGSNWNGNSFINMGIRLPLTEGLDRSRKLKQISLRKQINDLNFVDQQSKKKMDIIELDREAAFYLNKYNRTKENFEIAGESFQLAQEQYNSGRLLLGDLYRSDYNYQLEKNNYLNAAYNYMLTKIKLEKRTKE
jgi:outer membrane protein